MLRNESCFCAEFVAVESIDYGLFLVKPDYAAMAAEVEALKKK